MTLVENTFQFIRDTTASLLASILLEAVLFYYLAELASLCHSEPANGRAFVTLSVVEGLCVIPWGYLFCSWYEMRLPVLVCFLLKLLFHWMRNIYRLYEVAIFL